MSRNLTRNFTAGKYCRQEGQRGNCESRTQGKGCRYEDGGAGATDVGQWLAREGDLVELGRDMPGRHDG